MGGEILKSLEQSEERASVVGEEVKNVGDKWLIESPTQLNEGELERVRGLLDNNGMEKVGQHTWVKQGEIPSDVRVISSRETPSIQEATTFSHPSFFQVCKDKISRFATMLGIAGVAAGAFESKAADAPKPSETTPSGTPVYRIGAKSQTNQVFQATEQKNWGPGTNKVDWVKEAPGADVGNQSEAKKLARAREYAPQFDTTQAKRQVEASATKKQTNTDGVVLGHTAYGTTSHGGTVYGNDGFGARRSAALPGGSAEVVVEGGLRVGNVGGVVQRRDGSQYMVGGGWGETLTNPHDARRAQGLYKATKGTDKFSDGRRIIKKPF